MQSRFARQITHHHAGKRILAAVSGGVDSVVMLDLLCRAGVTTGIVHVNFQLRGEASDKDEQLVRQLAVDYGVPLFVKRFDTNNYAIDQGISIQMAARDLRYAWFAGLLDQEKYDAVATAHHLNDSIETFFINAVRGTGLAGLKGIPTENGRVIRPLLEFKRGEIEGYAIGNKLTWREDASNASDDYQRNFIRHQIIPRLKELNPSLEDTFARTLKRIEAGGVLADTGLAVIRDRFVSSEGDHIIIDKSVFSSYPNSSAILFELINGYGFNVSQCEAITEASNGQSGKRFQGDGCELIIDRDTMIIMPSSAHGGFVSIAGPGSTEMLGDRIVAVERTNELSINPDPSTASLDESKITFPLIWRTWKDGDEFYPLGMKHRKKISDFLIDQKVPLSDKRNVTVIESAGAIIWIPGYRIDNRFKVTGDTVSVVRLTMKSGSRKVQKLL